MPLVQDTSRDFNQFDAPEQAQPAPTFAETVNSAFALENDVANVLDMLDRPSFPAAPDFRVGKALRDYDLQNRTSLFADYRDEFLGVRSPEEMLYKIQRIRKQEADRDTLSRSGALAIPAAVGAGLMSPTMFIPFLAGGRGLAAVGRGALSGLAATAPGELALYANQETRTPGELATGLAAGTALGGILGGAISALRKGEAEVFEQELLQAARPGGVGAEAAERFQDAGGLASGAQTIARANDATGVFTNPVTQTINQTDFTTFRTLMQQLSDSGLRMAKNDDFIPASPGGTIENRLNYYTGMLVKGDESFNDAYNRYFFDGEPPKVAANLRAGIGGALSGSKLSAADFAVEVSRAIRAGFQHEIPEVAQAAQAVSKEVYEPILKLAQEAEIFGDDVKVVGDEAYVNRLYNTRAIERGTQEFVDILTEHYSADLAQRFADELEGFKVKQSRRQELAEDLARPEDEVAELQQTFRDALRAKEEGLPEELQMLEEAIASHRATARAMRQAEHVSPTDEATIKQLLKDAREMEKASPELQASKADRAALRRRISNLNKAVVAVDAKRAAKLAKIDRTEELELASLMRLVNKAQGILKKLDRVSDKVLDKEVSNLRTMFARAGEIFDRGEERIARLRQEDPDIQRLTEEAPIAQITTTPVLSEASARAAARPRQLARVERVLTGVENVTVPKTMQKELKAFKANPSEETFEKLLRSGEVLRTNGKLSQEVRDVLDDLEDLYNGSGQAQFDDDVRFFKKTFPEAVKRYRDVNLGTLENWLEAAKTGDEQWARDAADLEAIRTVVGEKRRAEVANTNRGTNSHRLGAAEDAQQLRGERLNEISDRLEGAENLDRASLRVALQDGLDQALAKVNNLNSRRVLRSQRLREQVKKLDPKIAEERLAQAKGAPARAEGEFARRWETQFGADSVDLEKGIADFTNMAKQSARDVTDKILGTFLRLPYSEVMQMERGAELRRVLHIPSKKIEKFLDNDIRRLTRVYSQTLGPDIELKKKFGTLNAAEWIAPASEERYALIEALNKREKPENVSQADWDKKIAKKTAKINDAFNLHKRNVEAVVQRLRGTRGMPSNPNGFAYRAARTLMNLNVLRMMGMVTVSSLPDMARPVMRYGLTRTFRDAVVPMITGLKGMKLVRDEARLAGVGTNISAHQRAMAVRDLLDDTMRGSALEKGIEYATNRMGHVALFEPFTQAMEMISAATANAKLMDSLAKVNIGDGDISLREAQRYLAENGLDGVLAERIWNEVKQGGGGKVDGTWWPNTESWKDREAIQAYRAALARETLVTIPRPGAERALLSDVNTLGRMLYQFKSFGMASMAKIVLAGAQQRDVAALSGSMAALGLGMLSYYLWAVATGGKSYTEMMNAGPEKWADEAISRSGLLGNVGELQRVAQTIPLFAPYTSFSGKRQTRRPGDDAVEALFGPSFDFVQNATGVLSGLHEPTQSTLRQLRRLMPYQNTLGLREVLDLIENSVGQNLPERRQQ